MRTYSERSRETRVDLGDVSDNIPTANGLAHLRNTIYKSERKHQDMEDKIAGMKNSQGTRKAIVSNTEIHYLGQGPLRPK